MKGIQFLVSSLSALVFGISIFPSKAHAFKMPGIVCNVINQLNCINNLRVIAGSNGYEQIRKIYITYELNGLVIWVEERLVYDSYNNCYRRRYIANKVNNIQLMTNLSAFVWGVTYRQNGVDFQIIENYEMRNLLHNLRIRPQ